MRFRGTPEPDNRLDPTTKYTNPTSGMPLLASDYTNPTPPVIFYQEVCACTPPKLLLSKSPPTSIVLTLQ